MWEVDVTLVRDWLLSLGEDDYDLVIAALEILQDDGPTLGRHWSTPLSARGTRT